MTFCCTALRSLMALRVISRQFSNSVALGAKRTFSEPRLPNRIYEYAPRSLKGNSNRNLAADLDHLLARQAEIVGDVRRISDHGREQRLLPVRQRRAVAAVQNVFVTDIVGHVVE